MLGLFMILTGTASMVSAEGTTLDEVRVGNHGDFIRIVFELSNQVQYQLNQDIGANQISIRFLETSTTISKIQKTAQSSCLEEVATSQLDDQVVTILRFNPGWNKLSPFTLREPDRIVLDAFCSQGVSTDQSQTQPKLEQTDQAADTPPEIKSEVADSISPSTNAPSAEMETAPTVTQEPPKLESATQSAVVSEPQNQASKPVIIQADNPVATPKVAPQKKDPFQKYLLILLAAITSVIIILIALILIQKRSQSAGSDIVRDKTHTDPDDTMRAIDRQIKAKLMKYDEQ